MLAVQFVLTKNTEVSIMILIPDEVRVEVIRSAIPMFSGKTERMKEVLAVLSAECCRACRPFFDRFLSVACYVWLFEEVAVYCEGRLPGFYEPL